jgi:hypothetical protein
VTEGTARWSRHCQSLFRTSIKVQPIIKAATGQLANVIVRDSQGNLHYHSGQWVIYGIQWVRRPDGPYMILKLERRTWN